MGTYLRVLKPPEPPIYNVNVNFNAELQSYMSLCVRETGWLDPAMYSKTLNDENIQTAFEVFTH
jgi:hypothetical protein